MANIATIIPKYIGEFSMGVDMIIQGDIQYMLSPPQIYRPYHIEHFASQVLSGKMADFKTHMIP
jgi:hypothetical protein